MFMTLLHLLQSFFSFIPIHQRAKVPREIPNKNTFDFYGFCFLFTSRSHRSYFCQNVFCVWFSRVVLWWCKWRWILAIFGASLLLHPLKQSRRWCLFAFFYVIDLISLLKEKLCCRFHLKDWIAREESFVLWTSFIIIKKVFKELHNNFSWDFLSLLTLGRLLHNSKFFSPFTRRRRQRFFYVMKWN